MYHDALKLMRAGYDKVLCVLQVNRPEFDLMSAVSSESNKVNDEYDDEVEDDDLMI